MNLEIIIAIVTILAVPSLIAFTCAMISRAVSAFERLADAQIIRARAYNDYLRYKVDLLEERRALEDGI